MQTGTYLLLLSSLALGETVPSIDPLPSKVRRRSLPQFDLYSANPHPLEDGKKLDMKVKSVHVYTSQGHLTGNNGQDFQSVSAFSNNVFREVVNDLSSATEQENEGIDDYVSTAPSGEGGQNLYETGSTGDAGSELGNIPSDLFGQLTPCVPVNLCLRAYGSRPTDTRDYGVITTCPEIGTVRCLDLKNIHYQESPISFPVDGPTHFVIPIVENVAEFNPDPVPSISITEQPNTIPESTTLPILSEIDANNVQETQPPVMYNNSPSPGLVNVTAPTMSSTSIIPSQSTGNYPKFYVTPTTLSSVTPTTLSYVTPTTISYTYGVPGVPQGEPLGLSTSRFGYPYGGFHSIYKPFFPILGFRRHFSLSKGFGFFG